MQKKHVLISMLAILTLILSVVNTSAWVYPDCSEDALYEEFGPRVDRVLIKLYSDDNASFRALEDHEIDLTDWPLRGYWITRWNDWPYTEYIKKVSYGADYGMRVLDINNNATIAAQGDMPCVTRMVPMRQAIACLVKKDFIVNTCVGGQGYELWSLFGPGWTVYQHPEIRPGGTLESLAYLYSPTRARQILTNDANFQFSAGASTYGVESTFGDHLEWNPGTGWEDVWLDFFIREDDPERKCAGYWIAANLMGFLGVYCDVILGDIEAAKTQVMTNKNFHLYTGGWDLYYEPDWAWYLYSIDWYWHPGRPLNYDCVNNTLFNSASYKLATAKNESQALRTAHVCAEALAEEANVVPLWEPEGTKAYHRTYVGPEWPYHGKNWTHLVNEAGRGIDSFWSILNMYPEGYPWGDGENMTLRWGFRVPGLNKLNPLYSSTLYDWNVLDLIYDSLLYTNPYEPSEWMNYLTTSYTVGTWFNPATGKTCNKIDIVLNSSVFWSDGTPLTMIDVAFSLDPLTGVESLLAARGCPPPWFSQYTAFVWSVTITGTYTGTIFLNDLSIYAWHAVARCPMLPATAWGPIVTDPTLSCDDLMGWGPDLDPYMVGTGPFLFVEYAEGSPQHVLLARNPRYFRLPPEHRTSTALARFIPKTKTCLHTPYDEDIVFDASASVSAFQAGTEYPITQYRWDWDNDGSWDHTTATPTINYSATCGMPLPITYAGHGTCFNTTSGEGCSSWKVTLEVYAATAPPGLKTGRMTNIINLIPERLMPFNFDDDCDIDIDDIRAICDAYIEFWTRWSVYS